ncbi:HAD-IA family hydrolase [Salinimonas sp. HHU 13199]|uniref:HAD-IA family hydrolase n=1 Tax=Salinimonas profundi TaxID=2729140 RepID=A0ABR8LQW2_9ALTE|nr:HAD-IA family hydrolase [Salinimonas profundi]MBD3586505.1 HAD-IA family hydrolase [Salinimonas profundi]
MRFYRPLNHIQAMTFDLDDTLYDNGPVIRAAEKTLQAFIARHYKNTSALSPEQWQKIRHQLLQETPDLSSDMGQLRMRTLMLALQEDISDDNDRKAAAKACFDCFYTARSELELHDTVHTTLKSLAEKIPLIGITNGNVDVKKIGVDTYFSTVLHASLERPMKPHRHMFDEAAQALGIAPAHILHVGDNLTKDVFGAICAGKQTAWFACNRPMNLNNERAPVLPHVELDQFEELLALV